MEKYITSIKDLVIQVMSNGAEIKDKAEKGDAESCFKMGMIHLLGVNTQIDFKKATYFLGNPLLSDNPDANRLLGFIAECEGDFSKAFQHYAKAEGNEKDSYISKVIKSRKQLQQYLKRFKLDTNLNNEVSAILTGYKDNSSSKTGVCVKIASLCNDEQTCVDAAQCLHDSGDYISALQWLKKGDVDDEHQLRKSIAKRFEKAKDSLKNSTEFQIIEIKDNSLLGKDDTALFFEGITRKCKQASLSCSQEWKGNAQKRIKNVIDAINDAEQKARMEYEAEEDAKRKKRKKLIKYGIITAVVIFLLLLGSINSSSDKEKDTVEDTLTNTTIVENEEKERTAKNDVNIQSEEYLKNYLNDILPKAIKIPEEKAIEKYFSKDFKELYKKVEECDIELSKNEDFEIGFWDFDFWTGGQDGELSSISVVKISDFRKNKAEAIIQYLIKSGEYDEGKSSHPFTIVFENGSWKIDDFNSYKFRFENYLKEVGK